MRIGLVTPLSARSAIGRHGKDVGEELQRRGWAVEILRSEVSKQDFEPPWNTDLRVSWLSDSTVHELNTGYDTLLYNLGDNYLFHGAALDRMPQCPGFLIAHDFYLYNLFLGWLSTIPSPDRTHEIVVSSLYGASPASLHSVHSGEVDFGTVASSYPMLEWVSQFAVGALAHAHFYADRLRSSCLGPVGVAPLAYRPPEVVASPKKRKDILRIATLGNANANKRILSVINAIGSSAELKEACEYFVVGEARPEDRERWNYQAERLGLRNFQITGHVSDKDFAAHIESADILTCLRDPIFEGGSGSLVEGLLSGRPVIVSSHGCYAEIPENCAFRIRPEHEHQDLTNALRAILHDEHAAALVGAAGRNFALIEHSVERYVDRLMPLAEAALAWTPVISSCLRLGRELLGMSVDPNDPIVSRLSQSLTDINWQLAGRSSASLRS
jgi:glycosyltransferase involved in cell wall biosynthesis